MYEESCMKTQFAKILKKKQNKMVGEEHNQKRNIKQLSETTQFVSAK